MDSLFEQEEGKKFEFALNASPATQVAPQSYIPEVPDADDTFRVQGCTRMIIKV